MLHMGNPPAGFRVATSIKKREADQSSNILLGWNDSEPTDKDLKIIFPSEAKRTIGHQASKVEGTTWAINDPSQFLDHYYQ
jgi:hypothetical protein